MPKRRLVLITGMSGSGKTTLAGLFRDRSYRVLTMGDVIRDLAQERGLEPTPANLGRLAQEIREEGGMAAVAKKCVEKLETLFDKKIVVDGIRSMREVDIFAGSFDVELVAVFASPATRYRRLRDRHRTDDPADWRAFRVRDERELGFSLGRAVALADHMVVNEGGLDDLSREFEGLLSRIDRG
jgi:dephospho-CoA kinase